MPSMSADWRAYDAPKLTESSEHIHQQVNALPELHMANHHDKNQAAKMLIATFTEQQAHAKKLNQALTVFRNQHSAKQWALVEKTKYSLDSLSQDKSKLLNYVTDSVNERFTGFGPDGVRQLLLEVSVTESIVNYQVVSQYRSFIKFINDLKISPVPVLVLIFKLLVIYFALSWWLKAGPAIIVRQLDETQLKLQNNQMSSHTFWRYFNIIQVPVAWFIAMSLLLQVLVNLPGLESLNYLSVIINWSFSAAIIIRLLMEFTAYHSYHNNQSDVVALRVRTLKRWVWTLMVAGIIIKATTMSVYQGTIYAWVNTLILIIVTLLLIKTLRDWRNVIFVQLERNEEQPNYIQWAIKRKDNRFIAPIATLLGIIRLFTQRLFQELFNSLSQYQSFKHAIAYFFRIEVAKQSKADKDNANMARIKGEATFNYVKPGHEQSELINHYASDELNEISRYVLAPIPAMAVLYGERGLGLTTLLKRVIYRAKSQHAIYINCPHGGYNALVQQLCASLDLQEDAQEVTLIKYLRASEQRIVFCIDNCQRIISPKVNGLHDLMRLSKLLRRGRNNHGVVLGIEVSAWRFVDRARGERLLFDKVIAMPRWNEDQIASLLSSRIETEGEYALSFKGLKLPKQWDEHKLSDTERAEQGFYRILWDYSDGNPSVALRFFRQSLHQDKQTEEVFVRIFKAPDAKELENMPKPMLAVLRAIVQLEVASAEELSDCTQLGFAEVLNTLRYFQNRGFIELIDDKAKISSHWFRYITNTLHNQHLLVK
ncbi:MULTISPECIES: ATP-binding protein [Shewanella]|nr:ATP-binding protein [Shewanella sp. XMDDZSB0408]